MSITIVCPSGFAGTARRWKGKELTALADQIEADEDLPDGGMHSLLSGPWETITDPGPYRFHSSGELKPDWNRMLKGDILGALYHMRLGSFRDGATYDFDFQCDRERCKKRTEWSINLETDILTTAQELPASSREAMLEGVDLKAALFDGTPLTFRLGSVEVEKEMAKLRKQQIKREERVSRQGGLIDAITAQTITVGGERLDIRKRYAWASELDLDDVIDIAEQYNDADCGYETGIEVRCLHCRWVQEIDLPLGRNFLVPSRQRQRRKKKIARANGAAESADASTTADGEKSKTDPPTSSQPASTAS